VLGFDEGYWTKHCHVIWAVIWCSRVVVLHRSLSGLSKSFIFFLGVLSSHKSQFLTDGSVIPTSEISTLNVLVASVAGTSKQKRMCGCLRRCDVRTKGLENACVVLGVNRASGTLQTWIHMPGRNTHGHTCLDATQMDTHAWTQHTWTHMPGRNTHGHTCLDATHMDTHAWAQQTWTHMPGRNRHGHKCLHSFFTQ